MDLRSDTGTANLDRRRSNPALTTYPHRAVHCEAPCSPRCLGRKIGRRLRLRRGGPDHPFLRRSPTQPAGWAPQPCHGRVTRQYSGTLFLLLHAFGLSPHAARPGCACGSNDRHNSRSSALLPGPPPLVCFSFASLGRRRPRLIRDAIPASSADAWPAAPRAYPPSAQPASL